ncbi:glycerophosphodiester phosphodiesterase [Peribacillus deserti]|uniref:Glycerophosphodiester phosphodiesterase n=1 Tax=Peribacillus deserti TaxID=673318 RepID=A0A2N5M2T5_9BACI|nr:glycerophosphodiester phosphodiesterase family protein [Peribacillus deserti]PLT28583.1 glycerophosphodiester phosphodiesterase [Peribacillus deserti]
MKAPGSKRLSLFSLFPLLTFIKKGMNKNDVISPKYPLIIAHRGASGYCPENTLAAFNESLKMGTKYIELDIQLSRDGELVVIHDTTLERTTNGKGYVKNWTYEDLSRLDAGSWFNEQYKEERIQRLQDVLARYNEAAGFVIEIKKPALYQGIEEKLADALSEITFQSDLLFPVMVQSFDENSLKTFRSFAPDIPIGLLVKRQPAGISTKRMKRISQYAQFINPKINMVNRRLIKRIHSVGLGVFVWTVKDKKTAEKLRLYGVDGIITDFPDLFNNRE